MCVTDAEDEMEYRLLSVHAGLIAEVRRIFERENMMARRYAKIRRALRIGAPALGPLEQSHSSLGSVQRVALRKLVDRVGHQAVLHLGDANVPKVVDEIAPGVIEPTDARYEGDHTSDRKLLCVHPPPTQQQGGNDLEVTAQVHQKVHCEFEPKNPHVEFKDMVDTRNIGPATIILIGGRDYADAEAAQYSDTDFRALKDRPL
jgi:hypothetical protein